MGITDRASGLDFRSQEDAVAFLVNQYEREVASGKSRPFTYPIGALGAVILLLYMLLPPESKLDSKFLRRSVFVVIAGIHIWLMYHCKSFNPVMGFGIGLVMSWGTIWSAVLLVFHNAKVDFKRIQVKMVKDSSNTSNSAVEQKNVPKGALHGMPKENTGAVRRKPEQESKVKDSSGTAIVEKIETKLRPKYYWQAYPSEERFSARLDWVLDLCTNFRGSLWNWRVSGLPSMPTHVQIDLGTPTDQVKDVTTSRTGVSRFDDRWEVVKHNMWLAIKGYYGFDAVKTLMSHDPYFWGLTSRPPPAYYPWWIKDYPIVTNSYRAFLSMSMVWLGLRSIFCLAPLVFVFCFDTSQIGTNAEPWAYPDHFGSYWQVFDRGLAGWWGGWWHQTFRFAFQSAGDYALRKLGIHKRSDLGKFVGMAVAFTMSGILHARGSITMMGYTSPWMGSFMFFFLQPIGISIETYWIRGLKVVGIYSKIPKWLGIIANVVFTHVWFYWTAPLLIDDFANGGLWLFEPFPITTFRGIGLGPKPGFHWFPWGTDLIRWHSDKSGRWWLSGIAI